MYLDTFVLDWYNYGVLLAVLQVFGPRLLPHRSLLEQMVVLGIM